MGSLRLTVLTLGIAMLAASSCATSGRQDSSDVTVRIATYNVGAFHKSGMDSTPMIASMMKETGVQIISLNELDSCTARHNNFQIEEFAKQMVGWGYKFAPAMDYQGGKYGIGIAWSKDFTPVKTDAITLDKADGAEQRALAVAEFDRFVFCSCHLDHVTENARLVQAGIITDYVKAHYGDSGKPVILCGDFNDEPDSRLIKMLEKDWKIISPDGFTIPSNNPRKRIDFIMVNRNCSQWVEVFSAEVRTEFSTGDVKLASDHLPVVMTIKIGRNPSGRP